MLGDHEGFFDQFDLLDNFPRIGQRRQAVGAIHRTARQLMPAVTIDLLGAKSPMLIFGPAGAIPPARALNRIARQVALYRAELQR